MSRVIHLAVGLLTACNLGDPVGLDGSAPGDSREEGAEASSDGGQGDGEAGPPADGGLVGEGPVVMIISEIAFDDTRRFDLDGDGALDNALADLGRPGSEILAQALDAIFQQLSLQGDRLVFHFPSIEDRATPHDPEAELFIYNFVDAGDPPDPTDDLSGHERVYADGKALDSCGRPAYGGEGASVDEGSLSIESDEIVIGVEQAEIQLQRIRGQGALAAGSTSLEVRWCGYAAVGEVGLEPGSTDAGLSLLEELIGGGAALGVPTVQGLAPDIDVDGDGLEELEVDDEGRIVSCVDGDRTVIDGRDCWTDARMADGISLCFDMEGVPGLFSGREPAWEYEVPTGCPLGEPVPVEGAFGGVVARSLPPGAAGAACDPLATEPCSDHEALCTPARVVDGEARYRVFRCQRRCEPARCDYGELAGVCIGGACFSPFRSMGLASCADGEVGCETEYGATEGTTCRVYGTTTVRYPFCLETCEGLAADCGSSDRCVPLVFEDGGFCTDLIF